MITIAEYILTRLRQLGVQHMFGVPGELNLAFSDIIEDHTEYNIKWVGGCNELNSAYAADGYARVKQSLGVLLTIFGPGELSAMNGYAGAASEDVPLLHIVGVPSTIQQKNQTLVDHTLGDGRYDDFSRAARQMAYPQAIIDKKEEAASKIDRILIECISNSRPGYLALPTDLVTQEISSDSLQFPLSRYVAQNDPAAEKFVVDRISHLFGQSMAQGEEAVVLVDLGAIRHDVVKEVYDLVNRTGFPVFCTPMAKTAIDETYERYGGVYWGSILSRPEVKEKVENANIVLSIGSFISDFNMGNFNYNIQTSRLIELQHDRTNIQGTMFPGVGMKQLIPKLANQLHHICNEISKTAVAKYVNIVPQESDDAITNAWLWPRFGEFFKENDIILAETGSPQYGIIDIPLPKGSVLLSQMRWASIGWTVGATLGACLAASESTTPRRSILLVGDGSLQMTVQELSSIIRAGLKPIIFVFNNHGYTTERMLHRESTQKKYPDLALWDYAGLLKVLGDLDGTRSRSYKAHTKQELSALLNDEKFGKGDTYIELVEIFLDKLDAPYALTNWPKAGTAPARRSRA
ncbi:Putative pyruvate decarboxylase C3G9.11c [Psilocybe cubensis]|uniref:Pyruvate decarboxylase n=2 Tax=Psilocybe cubensis TaxID=181762 RepID=A0A8H7XNE8_PSICU|nr:Putative pyruvate decarboxylase C3G9.11c [Psilocybe cubensis]KAH9481895.1 Putative pyruvate decarboxylase C3G9.11c [Psilocybe cubensis]